MTERQKLGPVTAEVTATTLPKGRRSYAPAHEVQIGPISVRDHSKVRAKAAATEQVQFFLDHWEHPTRVTFTDCYGHEHNAFIAMIGVTTVNSGSPDAELEPVFQTVYVGTNARGPYHGTQSGSARDMYAAKAEIRYRMADRAVSSNWEDPVLMDSVCDWLLQWPAGEKQEHDLRRYAGFQIAYPVAEQRGEADPHRWAGDHQNEYAPKRQEKTTA